MPRDLKLIEMASLIATLETDFPDLEWEADRAWVWITTDLAPLHKGKCACLDCTARAITRKRLFKDGLGFIFAKNGHQCPSGAISFAGHHCSSPRPFRRRKGKTEPVTTPSSSTAEEISDAELLQMLG